MNVDVDESIEALNDYILANYPGLGYSTEYPPAYLNSYTPLEHQIVLRSNTRGDDSWIRVNFRTQRGHILTSPGVTLPGDMAIDFPHTVFGFAARATPSEPWSYFLIPIPAPVPGSSSSKTTKTIPEWATYFDDYIQLHYGDLYDGHIAIEAFESTSGDGSYQFRIYSPWVHDGNIQEVLAPLAKYIIDDRPSCPMFILSEHSYAPTDIIELSHKTAMSLRLAYWEGGDLN